MKLFLRGTPSSLRCLMFGALFLLTALAQAVTIVTDPKDKLDAVLNTAAEFSVEAEGSKLFYQWRLNGVNIPGATGQRHVIESIRLEDGGSYSVAVSDEKETVESNPALLTLDLPVANENDHFASASPLSGDRGAVRSLSKDATRQSGEPKHGGKAGGKSVWFKWSAPASGVVTFRTAGSSFDTLLGVYTGRLVDQLTPVPGTLNGDDRGGYLTSLISFNVQEKQVYQIAVDGLFGANGHVVLSWDFEESLDFYPLILQAPQGRTVPDGGKIDLNITVENADLEWLFQGVRTGIKEPRLLLDAKPENMGAYVVEVTGRNGRKVNRVVLTDPADMQINDTDGQCDTNSSAMNKFAEMADFQTPKFASSGKGGSTSSVGPARGVSVTQIFSTVGAAKDPGEPNHCGVAGGASEWFAYQAPAAGTLTIGTAGSSFNTVLAVYKGDASSFATLTAVDCDNSSSGAGGDFCVFDTAVNVIYYIAVDGVGGASGTVQLNIRLGAPNITDHPDSLIVAEGSNPTFTVTATGTAPLTYQWRFNGSNIFGATTTSYTRNNVQVSHAGQYTVRVSNSISATTSQAATLAVLTAPTVTTNPASQIVVAGTNVNFTVGASGSPTLRYQWSVNGTNLVNGTNAVLSLTNVQSHQAGSYVARVTNSVGTAFSSPALLTVNVPPAITGHPASRTVTNNADISVVVTATGTAPLRYQWRKNGNPISGTNATLNLFNVQTNDAGTYSVVVTNVAGLVTSSNAVLTVHVAPSISVHPASKTVALSSNPSLLVSASGNPAPTFQWQFNGTNLPGQISSSLTINNFQKSNEGNYRVLVSNPLGSVPSASATLLAFSPIRTGAFSFVPGTFQLQFIGEAGTNYVFEVTEDWTLWTPLQTNSSPSGFLDFSDPGATENRGFYRVRKE